MGTLLAGAAHAPRDSWIGVDGPHGIGVDPSTGVAIDKGVSTRVADRDAQCAVLVERVSGAGVRCGAPVPGERRSSQAQGRLKLVTKDAPSASVGEDAVFTEPAPLASTTYLPAAAAFGAKSSAAGDTT